MFAIDTNIRYLTNDHPKQSAKARELVEGHELYVSLTVMLESEWVLRGVYDFAPAQIYKALRAFAGLPHVTLESPSQVAQALDHAEKGMDFADAIHLTSGADCDAMITFDKTFIKMARKAGTEKVREP
jgi:predicted nucleic-acid-binding protein